MATEKSLYFIAMCVMVVGLGNSLVSHHRDFARSLGQRAAILASSFSGNAEAQLDRADVVFDRSQASFDRGQAAMDRARTRMACLQTRLAQHQAQLARVQADQARLAVARSVRKIVVTVPEIPSKTIVVNGWDESDQ